MWKNRIIRHGEASPDELLANPQNWRIHPREQQEMLAEILEEVGWLQEVIVNLRIGEEWGNGDRNVETMVDGHLRVILAIRKNERRVPVTYVDLNPQEEALALLFFDRLTAMAKQDEAKVVELIAEIDPNNPKIAAMLAELEASLDAAMRSKSEEEAPEDFGDVDADLETDYRCPHCGYEWSGEPK